MKTQEMREKSIDELSSFVVDCKKQLFEMRLQKTMNNLEDTSKIAKTKKMVAQAKTVIKEKQNNEVAKNA